MNKKKSQVKDSVTGYGREWKLKFSSMEEQQEENYRYWAGLCPEELIQNTVRLIRKIYADQLPTRKKENRLNFNSD